MPALVRCPACGERPKGALLWPIFRVTAFTALVAALVWMRGLPAYYFAPPVALIMGAIEIRRFQRAGRAHILKLVKIGQLPEARAMPPRPRPDEPLVKTVAPPPPPEAPTEPSLLGDKPDQ